METQNKLSKEEIEAISEYFLIYKKEYNLRLGKKLETVEEVFEAVKKGDFSFEDVFDSILDRRLEFEDDEEEDFFFENINAYSCENYFPSNDKKVHEGCWIKIRNENGFEVHYATESSRKRRMYEEIDSINKKIVSCLNKKIKLTKNPLVKMDDVRLVKLESESKKLQHQKNDLLIRASLGLKPYEVKIKRSKSKTEYYLPHQYTIVDNIEEFSDAYLNNIPAVYAKQLYTSQNKDAIFYLQSRGISRKTAEIMAALKQTYFKVDMVEALTVYNNFLRENVKIVHN